MIKIVLLKVNLSNQDNLTVRYYVIRNLTTLQKKYY